jgi:hypothetical protein
MTRLAGLVLALWIPAVGGALVSLGAYATDHEASQPALYGVLVLLAREADKWVEARKSASAAIPTVPPGGAGA